MINNYIYRIIETELRNGDKSFCVQYVPEGERNWLSIGLEFGSINEAKDYAYYTYRTEVIKKTIHNYDPTKES